MHYIRLFLKHTILVSIFLCCSHLYAQSVLPTEKDIQSRMDALSSENLPKDEQAALEQTFSKMLSLLKNKKDAINDLARVTNEIENAPRLSSEAKSELERLKNSTHTPISSRYAGRNVRQLDDLSNEYKQQLNKWQKQLAVTNSKLISTQTIPESAQAEINSNQKRIRVIYNALQDRLKTQLTPEQIDLLIVEQAELTARNQLLQAQLKGNTSIQDLSNTKRNLLEVRIKRIESKLLELQEFISKKRQTESEKTVKQQSMTAKGIGTNKLLTEASKINLKYSDYLLKSTKRLNKLTRDNLNVKQKLDSLNLIDQTLTEQLNVLKGSLLLSKVLYQQKDSLPKVLYTADLSDQIADIRLFQFELAQKRELIDNPSEYVTQLLAKQNKKMPLTAEQVKKLEPALLELTDTRKDLLNQVNRQLSTVLNESIALRLGQKQLQDSVKSLSSLLDEKMFWLPSNKTLNFNWIISFPQNLKIQLAKIPWRSNFLEVKNGLVKRPLLFLPFIIAIGFLLWRRGFIYRRLEKIHQDIGHFKRDGQLHTPLAILLNAVLALPGSLLLALCGFALQIDARGQNTNLGFAFFNMAFAWFIFYTTYRILSSGGVAQIHFKWTAPFVDLLHRKIMHLGIVVIVLVAIVTIAKENPSDLANDVIGRVILLACFALMAHILYSIFINTPNQTHILKTHVLIGLLFILLLLILIASIVFGYYYTVLQLTDRLIYTLYALITWWLSEAIIIRGLGVAARRLAYQRVLAKRQADGNNDLGIEEPALCIEQVNQQSIRLIHLTLFILFCVSLYLIWADLISVLSYLDNITIYQYTSGSSSLPISLKDLLQAMIVIGMTIVLARNLPGLLEVVVLSRLQLAQGSAYATTTLLSYIILSIGTVSTLSILGLSWDKLQWLVAALSVGLGFGLQEIFANFISGLIILFERPVRIGDVVTIGGIDGTISQIRIRATTITDFDNKELIVPNKTFVTDTLLNWSLHDSVTRIVLSIGLAYEVDLELTRKVVMQVAADHPLILNEPTPEFFFFSIGDSTFNYDLRLYVKNILDRNTAISDVHTAIVLAFREHNIDMAFNQLDVQIKNITDITPNKRN